MNKCYMNMMKKYKTIGVVLFCIVIIYSTFRWRNYLTQNFLIAEMFTNNNDNTSGNTGNSVDLPLTTTYSCKNFCGPRSICSITGKQCLSDVDCSGCDPATDPISTISPSGGGSILGDEDSGKLTFGANSQYSSLTDGYGTKQREITSNMYSKPISPNLGTNKWSDTFNQQQKLFNKRYKPDQIQGMPNYPKRYSLTGTFVDDGPFASNSNLPS